jgi:hypothetical protein
MRHWLALGPLQSLSDDRIFSRAGLDWTDRVPSIVDAMATLSAGPEKVGLGSSTAIARSRQKPPGDGNAPEATHVLA